MSMFEGKTRLGTHIMCTYGRSLEAPNSVLSQVVKEVYLCSRVLFIDCTTYTGNLSSIYNPQ